MFYGRKNDDESTYASYQPFILLILHRNIFYSELGSDQPTRDNECVFILLTNYFNNVPTIIKTIFKSCKNY